MGQAELSWRRPSPSNKTTKTDRYTSSYACMQAHTHTHCIPVECSVQKVTIWYGIFTTSTSYFMLLNGDYTIAFLSWRCATAPTTFFECFIMRSGRLTVTTPYMVKLVFLYDSSHFICNLVNLIGKWEFTGQYFALIWPSQPEPARFYLHEFEEKLDRGHHGFPRS